LDQFGRLLFAICLLAAVHWLLCFPLVPSCWVVDWVVMVRKGYCKLGQNCKFKHSRRWQQRTISKSLHQRGQVTAQHIDSINHHNTTATLKKSMSLRPSNPKSGLVISGLGSEGNDLAIIPRFIAESKTSLFGE